MEGKPNTPDIAHFNIVTAFTALALGLTFALPPSTGQHATEIFGVRFSFDFNLYALFPVFIAVIALAGSAWVLSGHTASTEKPRNLWTLLPNVILPGLSVFILSITLREMARSGTWWVVYVLGSLLFVLVLLAEYNVLDTQSETHPAAALGLVALSQALFLILSVALRTGRTRLFIVIPLVILASAFISLRSIRLRTQDGWKLEHALIIAILTGQLAIGLHYFFLTPLQYGLVLTAALYVMVSLACGVIQRLKPSELLVEPAVMIVLCIGIIFLIR